MMIARCPLTHDINSATSILKRYHASVQICVITGRLDNVGTHIDRRGRVLRNMSDGDEEALP
jgi:hypothetical protein